MSMEIDPKNVSTDNELRYLRDRPWKIDEYRRQGFIAEMDAVEANIPMKSDPTDETRIHTDQMRVGTQAPQMSDPRSSGVLEDDEVDDNYEEWSVADLKAEIEARNAERAEGSHLALSGNKDALVKRLKEDDEAEATA
jgi:hypothetical protein